MKVIDIGGTPYKPLPRREYRLPFPFTCPHCECRFYVESEEEFLCPAHTEGVMWYRHAECPGCQSLVPSAMPITKEDEAELRKIAVTRGLM